VHQDSLLRLPKHRACSQVPIERKKKKRRREKKEGGKGIVMSLVRRGRQQRREEGATEEMDKGGRCCGREAKNKELIQGRVGKDEGRGARTRRSGPTCGITKFPAKGEFKQRGKE